MFYFLIIAILIILSIFSYRYIKIKVNKDLELAFDTSVMAGESIKKLPFRNCSNSLLNEWSKKNNFKLIFNSNSNSTFLIQKKIITQSLVICINEEDGHLYFYSWTIFNGRLPVMSLPKFNVRRKYSLKSINEIIKLINK